MSDLTATIQRVLDLARALVAERERVADLERQLAAANDAADNLTAHGANKALRVIELERMLAAANARAEAAEAESLASLITQSEHADKVISALRADLARVTECNEAMRAPMKRLRDAVNDYGSGEGVVVGKVLESWRDDVAAGERRLMRAESDLAAARAELDKYRTNYDRTRNELDDAIRLRALADLQLAAARQDAEALRWLLRDVFSWTLDNAPVVDGKLIVPWVHRYNAAMSAPPAPVAARSPLDPPESIGAEDMDNPRPPKGTILDVSGKAIPAPAPDLAFGPPDSDGERSATAADGERYQIGPYESEGWVRLLPYGLSDISTTIEEAIAAANTHNRQRLAGSK